MKNLLALDKEITLQKYTLAERACHLLEDVSHEWWDAFPDKNFPFNTDMCHCPESNIDKVLFNGSDVIIELVYIDSYDDMCDLYNTITIPYDIFISEDDDAIKKWYFEQAKEMSVQADIEHMIDLVRTVSMDVPLYERVVSFCKDNNLGKGSSYNEIVEAIGKGWDNEDTL